MVGTVLHAVFNNSLSQNVFNQTVFSLRRSKKSLETNVDAMIMLSQEPDAITTNSAQNPFFFRIRGSFG